MNAIVVVIDSLRADHVGCYGNPWIRTPTLDALSKESVVFTRAYPESVPTIPMRRVLHTGLRTWPFREWLPQRSEYVRLAGWQRIPEDQITLAEVLNGEGYQTGLVTDTHPYFAPSMNFNRGFSQWHWVRGQQADSYGAISLVDQSRVEEFIPPNLSDFERQVARWIITRHMANQIDRKTEEDYQAPRVFTEAMRWLERNRRTDKFFLLVDSFDPHEPWDPPQEYVEMYDPGYTGRDNIFPRYGPSDYLSADELRHMRALYAGEVTMVDRWLGAFLQRARDLRLLDDSVLIVTSDHGVMLGEHGLTGKVSKGLWYELMDVPLFVRWPDGERAGTRVDAFAQHQDIVPTLHSALKVESPTPLDGIDLMRVAKETEASREYVVSGFDDYVWYRDDRWVYIGQNDGTPLQLFDIQQDPLQEDDLSETETGAIELARRRILHEAGGPIPSHRDKIRALDASWWRV
jgi:arylsulfatase A-like enzyme